MSTKGIEAVWSRALSDPEFAELLITDPDQALAEFDLTVEESMALKGEYKNGQKNRTSTVGQKSSSPAS